MFSEYNKINEDEIASGSADVSFNRCLPNNEDNSSGDEEDPYEVEEDEEERSGEVEVEATPVKVKGKGKLVVKPHNRRAVVRSQTQALSQVASGLSKMAEAQSIRHTRQMEADKAREEFLEFRQKESEENRRHELEIVKIFANAIMQGQATAPVTARVDTLQLPQWPYLQSDKQDRSAYNYYNSN